MAKATTAPTGPILAHMSRSEEREDPGTLRAVGGSEDTRVLRRLGQGWE